MQSNMTKYYFFFMFIYYELNVCIYLIKKQIINILINNMCCQCFYVYIEHQYKHKKVIEHT